MQEIIACIDGSRSATAVCEGAAWVARRLKAPLKLLHVLDHGEYPTQTDLSGAIGLGARTHLLEELSELDHQRSRLALQQGKLMLKAAEELALKGGDLRVSTLQRHGSLMDTLQELQQQMQLLVIGRQGEAHDSATSAIGGHLENVIRTQHCPILVMLPEYREPQRFMLAYDGSPAARKVLGMVTEIPLLKDLECHLVMAGEEGPQRENDLRSVSERLRASGFSTQSALLPGDTTEALLSYSQAHAIDLMVMGAYGHSRIRQFLVGSTTTTVIQRTRVPLLLLR